MTRLLWVFVVLLIISCDTLVVDPSVNAIEANDFTLAMSACQAVPGRGLDICHVTEGSKIESSWRLIVPINEKFFLGGELTVYFKDQVKSFKIENSIVNIPWAEVLGDTQWSRDHDGEALALAIIRFKNAQGIEESWRARGIAKIIVLKPGYSPLAIDSGYTTWTKEFKCKVGYSSSGRSWVNCQ